MTICEKSLHDLEWRSLLNHLAQRASCEEAADACLALPFLNPDDAWIHLDLVAELLSCINEDDAPPTLSARPVKEALAHVRSDSAVPAEALVDIAHNLRLFVSLCRYVENRADTCGKNASKILPPQSPLSPVSLSRLAAEIDATFEPDGTIRDSASAELGRLRRRVQSLRQSLLELMSSIAERHEDLLQDRTITLRGDRYVLPIRTDAHRPLPGIVHGSSGSGATMFIEPTEAVGAGNDLTMAREAVVREEQRILNALRKAVRDQLPEVNYACRTLIETEVRIAAARLSWDIDAAVPAKGTSGQIVLHDARHPLLLLSKKDVVPNDLSLLPGNTLLISGPNAGGKTVVLKTVGLFSLMLRAGLPISASAVSIMDMPVNVLSDIGDDQSLALALSTFSAHMTNIASILSDVEPGCVVLLDELCAGTDPVEGTALAAAILDKLNLRGATTLATTHYDTLKIHAQDTRGFSNAAMGFDGQRSLPTYRIARGVPGSSSALSVARGYGIPESVINDARARVPEGLRKMAAAVEALEKSREEAEAETRRLKEERYQLEKKQRRVEEELLRLKNRGEKFLEKESEDLWAAIRAAREKVREAEKSLRRRTADPAAIKSARDAVNEVASQLAPGAALSTTTEAELPGEPATVAALRSGQAVHVISMSRAGVVESDVRGNTVFVKLGKLSMRVPISDLRMISKAAAASSSSASKSRATGPVRPADFAAAPVAVPVTVRTDSNTLDLRGVTVDEALTRTDDFLDAALKSSTDVVFVLHGHGTGALRSAVRLHLSASPYVGDHRPGTREEGGDGITAVFLR